MVEMNQSTSAQHVTQRALTMQIQYLRLMMFAQYAKNVPKVVALLH